MTREGSESAFVLRAPVCVARDRVPAWSRRTDQCHVSYLSPNSASTDHPCAHPRMTYGPGGVVAEVTKSRDDRPAAIPPEQLLRALLLQSLTRP